MYPVHMHTYILSINISHESGTFGTIDEPTGHITITKCLYLTLQLTLGGVHSVGLERCIMACIHIYSIVYRAVPLS